MCNKGRFSSPAKDAFSNGLATAALNQVYADQKYAMELSMLAFIKNFLIRKHDSGMLESNGSFAVLDAGSDDFHYDPKLIWRLIDQHRHLAEEIHGVRRYLRQRDYKSASANLRAFKGMLSQHLYEEDVDLFAYLAHHFAGDATKSECLSKMHSEMQDIGRLVTRKVKQYSDSGVDELNAHEFAIDLENIITALHDRIEREESLLYAHYVPVTCNR